MFNAEIALAAVALALTILLTHVHSSKQRRDEMHKLQQEILQLRLWIKTIARAQNIYLPSGDSLE